MTRRKYDVNAYLLVDETVDRVIDAHILGEHGTLGESADGLDGEGGTLVEGAVAGHIVAQCIVHHLGHSLSTESAGRMVS